MSYIKRWIERQAEAAGVEPDTWLKQQAKQRAADDEYMAACELCANCGWAGFPPSDMRCPACHKAGQFFPVTKGGTK